jgi:hypothetical protein
MKKSSILALCVFLLGCESEKIDASKPVDIDNAVALFCKEANKELPKGSHIIVRKKDFESINNASKEYIHWKIMQNFTERKSINAYENDNITAQDLTDNGEIFTIKVRLEKWAGMPYHKGFFYMDKNGVKATDVSVLRKEYAIRTDDANLNHLLKEQTKEYSISAEKQLVDEKAKGSLKIINQSNGYLIGIRIYKSDSLLIDNKIDIQNNGGEEIRKLASGEYRLEIKDDFKNKFCSVGTFEITNHQTVTKIYRGCK